MVNRNTTLLVLFLGYWLITGAACDTFLEAEGIITLKASYPEQYDGKKLIGVWATDAKNQSSNAPMNDADICEPLGITCDLVTQNISVSYILQQDNTPVLNPETHDIVTSGTNEYPFKLNNIYGPGEKGRFAKNYIGAFIDTDGNGKWGAEEPFGWATGSPFTRGCVIRSSSEHINCINLSIPIE